jgi:hypothetical protein
MRPSPPGPLLVAGAPLRASPSRRGLPSAGSACPRRVDPLRPVSRVASPLLRWAAGVTRGATSTPGGCLRRPSTPCGCLRRPSTPGDYVWVRVLAGRGGWGAFVAPSRSSGWPEVLLVRVLGVLGGAGESRCSLAS